ncbi:MAG: diguanylate cyclase [Cyanobacteria bacterium J06621_11]
MNSVLLIGHSRFTDGLRSQVRGLDALTVTAVFSTVAAIPLIEKSPPDIIIIQAGTLIANSVVKTFGHHQVSYIVVVETALLPEYARAEFDHSQLNNLQLEKTSFALESGADAYLWLPSAPENLNGQSPDHQNTDHQNTDHQNIDHQNLDDQSPSNLSEKSPIKPPTQVFQANQCRLLQVHIQIGLSRAQRYRDLSRINDWLSAVALVDALTQINNRRALDLELPNQIRMAQSKAIPFSLMVLDIDYFKSVNDRFGHLVGDDILKQLAKRLLSNMRFYDTPFRFGGEEFVITLSNTDATESSAIANRLREIISDEPFTLTHPVSGVSTLAITVSIGLTELHPDDDEQGRSLLDRADKNLLIAKTSGRNQVVPAPVVSAPEAT